jgi:hypothetical protein
MSLKLSELVKRSTLYLDDYSIIRHLNNFANTITALLEINGV